MQNHHFAHKSFNLRQRTCTLPQQNHHFGLERSHGTPLVDPPLGGINRRMVSAKSKFCFHELSIYGEELAFYLNRTTTLSSSRPRGTPLVDPPLGSQSAIRVAQNGSEPLERDPLTAQDWSLDLQGTTTFVANGPVRPPRSSPLGGAMCERVRSTFL